MTMTGSAIALIGGDVRTMDPCGSRASAVFVDSGSIALVGDDRDVLAAADRSGARVYDVGGRTVVPGFVDAHTHLELTCCSLEYWGQAHTPPIVDLASMREKVRTELHAHPGDGWFVVRSSFGLHAKVAERRHLTRVELDELSPRRPLAVAAGLHVMSLNTAAMRSLGILDALSSPQQVIHRDDDGAATGVVTEVWDLLPQFSAQQVDGALRRHRHSLTTCHGVTTVGTIAFDSIDAEVTSALNTEGMPLRVRTYLHAPRLGAVKSLIAAHGASARSVGAGGVGGVKIFVDGQHGDGIAAVFDDFKWTQHELDDVVGCATDAGVQLLMHAVSPAAVRRVVTAIERSNRGRPNPLRHRIEHGGDCLDLADLDRIRRSGAILIATPQFISSTAGEADSHGAPLRSIVDGGARLAGGTDTTGTVPEGASPLYNIACAIAREATAVDGRSEALTFDQALRLFTCDAAYALFEEERIGQIMPGLAGDLVVLDRAVPEDLPSAEYFNLEVAATVFSGRIVHGSLTAHTRRAAETTRQVTPPSAAPQGGSAEC